MERGLINQHGRLCAIERELDYATYDNAIKGRASNAEEYTEAIWSIMRKHFTDKVAVAFRYFSLDNRFGMCPKSFPLLPRVAYLLDILHLCCGGETGIELIHLPEPGTILDQNNVFIQSYLIYRNEVLKHRESEYEEMERRNSK